MDTNGRLLRDCIPEILEAGSAMPRRACSTRPSAYRHCPAKLQEERDELRTVPAERRQELADALEVLKGIPAELGMPWTAIESADAQKRGERTGFEAEIRLQLSKGLMLRQEQHPTSPRQGCMPGQRPKMSQQRTPRTRLLSNLWRTISRKLSAGEGNR